MILVSLHVPGANHIPTNPYHFYKFGIVDQLSHSNLPQDGHESHIRTLNPIFHQAEISLEGHSCPEVGGLLLAGLDLAELDLEVFPRDPVLLTNL